MRGEGHWGRGAPLKVRRKGCDRSFVDGAGLPSPGRWAIAHRRLPEGPLHERLCAIVLKGFQSSERKMPGKVNGQGDFKKTLLLAAAGQLTEHPFGAGLLEDVRTDLRLELKRNGHGDGLPREGDVVQHFEIRLIQSLLEAFGDPDHYFCQWWATGVWIGSPTRRLPRAPAIFDRKTRWKFPAPDKDLRGEWQTNYPSLAEHVAIVQKQFEAEAAEGLMLETTFGSALETYVRRLPGHRCDGRHR